VDARLGEFAVLNFRLLHEILIALGNRLPAAAQFLEGGTDHNDLIVKARFEFAGDFFRRAVEPGVVDALQGLPHLSGVGGLGSQQLYYRQEVGMVDK